MRSGAGASIVAVVVLASVLAGCGKTGKEPQPAPALTVRVEEFGPNEQITVPRNVAAGELQVHFTNAGSKPHSAQFVRFAKFHTPAAALSAVKAWRDQGKPLPNWINFAGGFASVEPGKARAGKVKLEQGSYMAVDLDAKGKPAYGLFEAHGGGSDELLPEQPRAVSATEYKFTATGLRGGPNRVLFSNTGNQPHEVIAYPINRGKTIADVRRWATTGRGRSPVDTAHGDRTAILDGKRQQLVQLNLRTGNYAFLCLSRDRQGGPEHVRKGMVSEVVVR